MLKLEPAKSEWLQVLGARILFRPIGRKAWREAQKAAARALRPVDGEGEQADEAALMEEAGDALSYALISAGIEAWEGVGDENGNAVEPTPEYIEMFLSDPMCFQAADQIYVGPYMARMREKNGLSPALNGISAEAMPGQDTATSPAQPDKGSDATNALTSKTSPKRKKGSSSGK